MVIKREVAYGIVQGLSEFWNCEELQDFTVTVGDTKFGCHKFLLAACSIFFRALFRSGMKETKQNCVTLEEISKETFQLILEAMYTGRGILTNDNVIDIWRAVHQLEIAFMVAECEMFVIKSLSLENYVEYFHCGRLLSSQIVAETIWSFILKHCDLFFKTNSFLKLPFEDVLNLIKSQNLETKSEDNVLKAILMWIQHTPDTELYYDTSRHQVLKINSPTTRSDLKLNENEDSFTTNNTISDSSSKKLGIEDVPESFDQHGEGRPDINVLCGKTGKSEEALTVSNFRKHNFLPLFLNARTYHASLQCLEILQCHPLVSANKLASEVISRAILYKGKISERSGHLPKWATNRNNSGLEHVAINFRNDYKLAVYSFFNNNWYEYKSNSLSDGDIIIRLITKDSSLYSFYVRDCNDADKDSDLCISYLAYSRKWSQQKVSLKLKSTIFSVVAVNEFIYIIQKDNFWRLDPTLTKLIQLPALPDDKLLCHVMVYDKKIIAFFSVPDEEEDEDNSSSEETDEKETAVLCFDVSTKVWTRLNNLEGPADGMTSFKDDYSTYLLQSNGNLWKLVKPQSDVVDFEFVVKLWHDDWPLHGAVIFLDELYIYGVKSETIKNDPTSLTSFGDSFKKIIYLQSKEVKFTKAMFLPFIVSRSLIVDK